MARGQTNEDKVLACIQARPGLDDDELAQALNIWPRQQINQICRRLEAQGQIARIKQPGKKIINNPIFLRPAK